MININQRHTHRQRDRVTDRQTDGRSLDIERIISYFKILLYCIRGLTIALLGLQYIVKSYANAFI